MALSNSSQVDQVGNKRLGFVSSAELLISARCRRFPVIRRSLHGFTLVELLVVIAIIGILVALLLPAVLSLLVPFHVVSFMLLLGLLRSSLDVFRRRLIGSPRSNPTRVNIISLCDPWIVLSPCSSFDTIVWMMPYLPDRVGRDIPILYSMEGYVNLFLFMRLGCWI